jgi:hypothetical protein
VTGELTAKGLFFASRVTLTLVTLAVNVYTTVVSDDRLLFMDAMAAHRQSIIFLVQFRLRLHMLGCLDVGRGGGLDSASTTRLGHHTKKRVTRACRCTNNQV